MKEESFEIIVIVKVPQSDSSHTLRDNPKRARANDDIHADLWALSANQLGEQWLEVVCLVTFASNPDTASMNQEVRDPNAKSLHSLSALPVHICFSFNFLSILKIYITRVT